MMFFFVFFLLRQSSSPMWKFWMCAPTSTSTVYPLLKIWWRLWYPTLFLKPCLHATGLGTESVLVYLWRKKQQRGLRPI